MSKFVYKDYYGKRITCQEAFRGYKCMEVSFEYDVTRLNLEHIAKEQIKDPAKLNKFNDLLDELVNMYAHKIEHQRDFRVKRWNYMQDIFRQMNDLLGLSEEEMKTKAIEFAMDYGNKEELMELGLRQIEILNS